MRGSGRVVCQTSWLAPGQAEPEGNEFRLGTEPFSDT